MMREGMIDDIQAQGYWRLNIQPVREIPRPLAARDARLKVANARVQMRGWDFPHVSVRDDASGGQEIHNNYVENWCDWYRHREFWRMFYSSQFLAYKTLWEDLEPEAGARRRPAGKLLSVQSAIWSIIEFFEFANRLSAQELYQDGAKITVNLRDSNDRRLWVTEDNRMDFSYPRIARAPEITFICSMSRNDLTYSHKTAAIDAMLHVFSLFGWDPAREQLERDQTKYYNREFD